MIRGVYLLYNEISLDKPSGIEKKIIQQFKHFEQCGISMHFEVLDTWKTVCWKNPSKYAQFDFIYFRRQTIVDINFLRFFSKVKKMNPNIIVFMEIPTFPYDGEYLNGVRGRVALIIDHLFRKFLNRVIDRVVITGYSDCLEFGGTKTINIVNGIDLSSIKEIFEDKDHSNKITIGCIGKLSVWHGYERLIAGLANYKNAGGKRDINILIVGDGPEEVYYRKLSSELGLEENIDFLGFLCGEQLEEVFSRLDFGCCSLGRYKSGLDTIGDLKSRDYLARGISLITGCDIDILKGMDYPFMVRFPNDTSPVDFEKIIDYYDNIISMERHDIKIKIKSITKDLIDFDKTFAPVTNEAMKMLRIDKNEN